MSVKGSPAERGRRLNSIKLKDFPENAGLADDFYDRESDSEATDETTVMTRNQIPDDSDGSDGLAVMSVSRLFDEDDISAGDTTLISGDELNGISEADQDDELSGIHLTDEDRVIAAEGAVVSGQRTGTEGDQKKKRQVTSPARGQINRNPSSVKKTETKPKKPVKVKNIGTRKHSPAYHIIKFCIFLLIWIAIAFASYQLYKFGYRVLNDQPMDPADASKIQITVTGNETDSEMGEKLLEYGLIDDVGIFRWRCRLYSSEYNAGTYRLSRSYNTEKILNIFAGYNYSDSEEEESSEEESISSAGDFQPESVSEEGGEGEAGGEEDGAAGDDEEDYGEEDNAGEDDEG